jgi:DNA-directed RNA polymerase specialized sigma24 family protein
MTDGSITHWIAQVKDGGESVAQQELWDRYFIRLAALASHKLHDLPPQFRYEEDLALSALDSFFIRVQRDDFSQLRDRTDLWRLLAKITVRKTIDWRRRTLAQTRGGGQAIANLADDLQNIAAKEPSPDMLVAMNEQCHRLLSSLNQELQTVARMKLEGYTNREIANSMGRVERTVERKLDRIRRIWLTEVEHP